eukprot:TRINITY_DN30765_c0_g1_i1.p1 TRINITY_DN30765_c0_g1~~TRINITY_DN30765_c0_g1_i1.p1  ORF type:complete len:501 (+),score=84.28 TRINITY_DN30765_c0_g1_i1:188-1504(+)
MHKRDRRSLIDPDCNKQPLESSTCDVSMEGLRILWASYCYSEVCDKSTMPMRESPNIKKGIQIVLSSGEMTAAKTRDKGLKKLRSVSTNDSSSPYDPKLPPGWVLAVNDKNRKKVSICVAGTQNINDVYRDTMCKPVPVTAPNTGGIINHSVKCHQGFHDGAVQLFNKIHPHITRYASLVNATRSSPLQISFTGHSLGGAVAILLSLYYSHFSMPHIVVSQLHTFGAPKVFVSECHRPVDIPELRKVVTRQFITDFDIVPRGLGSSKIAKLTSIANRLGISCAKFLTNDVVKHLVHYRPTSPVAYLLPAVEVIPSKNSNTKKRRTPVKTITGQDVVDTLSFNMSYLKPRGFSTHRVQVYLERLQAAAISKRNRYPLELGKYPFGVKERVLTESEMVKAEMSFLKDTQQSAYAEVQRILNGITKEDVSPEEAEILAWKR